MRRMERAGRDGEGGGVFWGGPVACCMEERKQRWRERRERGTSGEIKGKIMRQASATGWVIFLSGTGISRNFLD